ncbi:23S rRNA (guanine(745)-N(1))-methyltransferase [Crenothrix polyspora]|uniref:23S rRNA (Guanine(745)-N(1))-methyltransferase n=1 Tax=Crenothrix polyspora TaxID=360316 RepID=A0A1R4HDE6_9GAMM|nr:23S rRNA (guanine(745)-N(1))-methyltransferase [Crenothrix polyspora]SJM94243.1 23S rRNA (guanine(745)-N(1))-methyltransferase [Crenothrix polyspora]
MTCYQCPLCATVLTLQPSSKYYACQNQHHFDLAKEGYLNLLPVQHKHSLEPGDSKQMLLARREFLEAGYYAKMAEAVAMMIAAYYSNHQKLRLLDLGCGEGYYSRTLACFIDKQTQKPLDLHGVDIAKFAIAAAAKKQPDARFVVASTNRLPYVDHYFDLVLRIFAPSNALELNRVLKPSGLLLTVTPGPRHLWQLKEFIYTDVKEHTLEPELADGFVRIAAERIHYQITPNPAQRIALLQMTPFAWRANLQVQQTIQSLAELTIDVDFNLTLAKRLEDSQPISP